jgi:peroxiredoxin
MHNHVVFNPKSFIFKKEDRKMNKLTTTILAICLASVTAFAQGGDDVAAVTETLTKYAAAVQSKDMAEIEKYVVTTDDFTIFEGGHVNSGWADYKDHHEGGQDAVKLITSFYEKLGAAKSQPAPSLAFILNDGKVRGQLSDFRGKVLLLKFWEISCMACRAEFPEINKLQSEYSSRGLVILYLSFNTIDAQAKFFKEFHVVGEKAKPISESLEAPYASPIVPRSILIDRKGLVRDGWLGTLSYSEIQKKIVDLLNEP